MHIKKKFKTQNQESPPLFIWNDKSTFKFRWGYLGKTICSSDPGNAKVQSNAQNLKGNEIGNNASAINTVSL